MPPAFEEGTAGDALDLLLVAEPGGHLLELWVMSSVAAGLQRAWCTLDSADVRSLLSGERVLLCHGPTCRSPSNLLRNLRSAWEIVRRHRPRVILCTGSGIVVPFAWVGRLLGANVFYVECGGRVSDPSLSCRLVSPAAHAVYVQWPELAGRPSGARFCGRLPWSARPERAKPGAARRILITVGTSRLFAFDRLVESASFVEGAEQIVVQYGASSLRPAGAVLVPFLGFDDLCAQMKSADAVVTHGGIGSLLLALMHGHHPIVMPRRADLGESVDDHQLTFAARLAGERIATVVDTPHDVAVALRRGTRDDRGRIGGAAAGCNLLERLEHDVRTALADGGRRVGGGVGEP